MSPLGSLLPRRRAAGRSMPVGHQYADATDATDGCRHPRRHDLDHITAPSPDRFFPRRRAAGRALPAGHQDAEAMDGRRNPRLRRGWRRPRRTSPTPSRRMCKPEDSTDRRSSASFPCCSQRATAIVMI